VNETCEILSEVDGTGDRRNTSVIECHRVQFKEGTDNVKALQVVAV